MMVLLVWLHLLAVIIWIGGTIFLSVVLVPVLRRELFASQRSLLFRTIARRFRVVVWGAIAVLLFTGPPLLHQRGIPIANLSGWPMILVAKLGLVTFLLFLTLTHDLILGPRVGRILRFPTESRTRFDQVLVLWSPFIPHNLREHHRSKWGEGLMELVIGAKIGQPADMNTSTHWRIPSGEKQVIEYKNSMHVGSLAVWSILLSSEEKRQATVVRAAGQRAGLPERRGLNPVSRGENIGFCGPTRRTGSLLAR